MQIKLEEIISGLKGWFAAMAKYGKEKQKKKRILALCLADLQLIYVFEDRKLCPKIWQRKVFPVNCHFNVIIFYKLFLFFFQLLQHPLIFTSSPTLQKQTNRPPQVSLKTFGSAGFDSIWNLPISQNIKSHFSCH